MSITYWKTWVFALAAVLICTSAGYGQSRSASYGSSNNYAQNLWPFNPISYEHDLQPFAQAPITQYGSGTPPFEGYYFNYERLYWTISPPGPTPIGSVAAAGSAFGSPFSVGGTITLTNSLDTSIFNSEQSWGNRYELGFMDNRTGWMVGVLQNLKQGQRLDGQGVTVLFDDPTGLISVFVDLTGPVPGVPDGFDDDLDFDGIFGSSGEDTDGDGIPDDFTVPPDLDDLFLQGSQFTEVSVRQFIDINGIELMRTYRLPPLQQGRGLMELFIGLRLFRVQDRLLINGAGGVLDATNIETKIDNMIVGPQIGGRWVHQRGRWSLSTEGRFLAGFNLQTGKQEGIIASEATGAVTALASRGFNNFYAAKEFSPLAEFRAQLSYRFTKAISLRVGWNALWVDGVSRAANVVAYTLPEPGFRIAGNRESIFMQGISIGGTANY